MFSSTGSTAATQITINWHSVQSSNRADDPYTNSPNYSCLVQVPNSVHMNHPINEPRRQLSIQQICALQVTVLIHSFRNVSTYACFWYWQHKCKHQTTTITTVFRFSLPAFFSGVTSHSKQYMGLLWMVETHRSQRTVDTRTSQFRDHKG